MNKLLILIRHGSRNTDNRELDNGLDSKGQAQAHKIAQFAKQRFGGTDKRDLWLISSPKKRCIETLSPSCRLLNAELKVHADLNEKEHHESEGNFRKRIKSFLTEWKSRSEVVTMVCSHGDWLPIVASELLRQPYNCKKGSWLEFEQNEYSTELKWFIPSFKKITTEI